MEFCLQLLEPDIRKIVSLLGAGGASRSRDLTNRRRQGEKTFYPDGHGGIGGSFHQNPFSRTEGKGDISGKHKLP
jgi:hypothetical protein